MSIHQGCQLPPTPLQGAGMPDLLHEGIYIYTVNYIDTVFNQHTPGTNIAPSQEVCRKWLCSPKRFENDIPFSYVLGHLSNLSSFWVLQLLHTNCFTLAFFRRFGSSESFLNLKPRCHVHCNQNQQACYQACTCSNSCRKTQDSNAHNTCVRSKFFFASREMIPVDGSDIRKKHHLGIV